LDEFYSKILKNLHSKQTFIKCTRVEKKVLYKKKQLKNRLNKSSLRTADKKKEKIKKKRQQTTITTQKFLFHRGFQCSLLSFSLSLSVHRSPPLYALS